MESIILLIVGCTLLILGNVFRENELRNNVYDKSKVRYTDGDNT